MSTSGYFTYNKRTVVHSGADSIIKVPSLFRGLGGKRVLLVSDEGLEKAGLVNRVKDVFTLNNGPDMQLVGVYAKVTPDAGSESINDLVAYARSVAADSILALGGGSVLDAAKGLKYCLHHHLTDICDILKLGLKLETWPEAKPSMIPHIAIPTTAGTGAEVTNGAVIHNQVLNIKSLVLAPYLDADMAVLDAKLTLGLPKSITVATAFDALTHAIESIATPKANLFSDAHAITAAKVINENMPKVAKEPTNVDCRSKLLQASTMACNAVVNAFSAFPVHNFSHALGATFHIPHGDANGIMLPVVIETLADFYLPNAQRMADALSLDSKGLNAEQTLAKVVAHIRGIQRACDFDGSLKRFGVTEINLKEAIASVKHDVLYILYPVPEPVIEMILRKAL